MVNVKTDAFSWQIRTLFREVYLRTCLSHPWAAGAPPANVTLLRSPTPVWARPTGNPVAVLIEVLSVLCPWGTSEAGVRGGWILFRSCPRLLLVLGFQKVARREARSEEGRSLRFSEPVAPMAGHPLGRLCRLGVLCLASVREPALANPGLVSRNHTSTASDCPEMRLARFRGSLNHEPLTVHIPTRGRELRPEVPCPRIRHQLGGQ